MSRRDWLCRRGDVHAYRAYIIIPAATLYIYTCILHLAYMLGAEFPAFLAHSISLLRLIA
jgi:hypothetical protein